MTQNQPDPVAAPAETEAKYARYEKIPKIVYVFGGLFALSLLIYLVARLSPGFADFYNRYPGAFFRAMLAYATYIFPFSLAEAFIILSPALIVLLVVLAIRRYCRTRKATLAYMVTILSCASLLFSLFVLGFGCGYHGSSLDKKMNLDKQPVSMEELYDTANILVEKINAEARAVSFSKQGFSTMPYSRQKMNRILMDAYDSVCKEYRFIQNLHSKVKPILLSEWMSYTHITGVYAYFTGEANININFPDYTLPFTAAHELAHQRGIAREDEANFVAFLVCIASDDPYIRYSGYLNLYEYIASPLSADAEKYRDIYFRLDEAVRGEMRAYSAFFEKYRHSVSGKVSEAVNNTYLKSQGTVGTRSYGLVVDLAVAYYKEQKKQSRTALLVR